MPLARKTILQVVATVFCRPLLWPIAIRQLWKLRRSGWNRKPPFLPLPEISYLEFRLQTAYGDGYDGRHVASDTVTYLKWCRSWPSASR
ncbi:MAG: hypothetical protein QF596_02935 [Acidimicrobiales bacterium]|jgi:hypothetical protein|nr:hypothetical protein [Acidimicrobiales bacterium]HJM28089.1 hypothetical protein [Acidimicrobiales bacterium]HJM97569.1 hypothetical protein [Acidimicrobiales bacterium]